MRHQIANDEFPPAPRVTIFGVGGAGSNAVARLLTHPDAGLRIICANTDMQALRRVPKAHQLQLGRRLTSGLGAGAKPDTGRLAAEEALPDIRRSLEGTTLCFIAAGMGGGTGTGAAPVIAQAARGMGILTIAVATKPFAFEGARRSRVADAGSRLLEEHVDALVVVCNEHLISVAGATATLRAALAQSDSVVCESANHFAVLIAGAAVKRISVADMRSILSSGGRTVMGFGQSHVGPDRALHAARSALRNPLLEGVVTGARRLIVSVAGGQDLRLFEVDQAIAHVREHVCANAEIVWGSVIDPALANHVKISIAAAGLAKPDRIEMATLRSSVTIAPGAETAGCATTDRPPACSTVPTVDMVSPPRQAVLTMTEGIAAALCADQQVLLDGTGRAGVRSRHTPGLLERYAASPHGKWALTGALDTPTGTRGERVFRTSFPLRTMDLARATDIRQPKAPSPTAG